MADFWIRLLLHRLIRGRIGLCIPDIRRSILHLQIPGPGKLGARDIMAVRLVEPDRSDRWSCFYRVRLRSAPLGRRLDGRRFQWLCTHRTANRGGDGGIYRTARLLE